MERVIIVGPGRLGLALGHALAEAGAVASLVYQGRRPDPPDHILFHQDLAEYRFGLGHPEPGTTAVFLTVPDDALPEVAQAFAALGPAPPGCCVFHCSGVLGSDPLAPLHARGYPVGTFHPLQAIPFSLSGAERLRGASVSLSGDPEVLAVARRIIASLGGRGLAVPTSRRPVYHAAAVVASNYVVVLLAEAIRIFEELGLSREEAEEALTPLALGSLENVAELGAEKALTGPVSRGDVDTVELHLRALEREDAMLYAVLGRRSLELVRDRLAPEVVAELDALFQRYS